MKKLLLCILAILAGHYIHLCAAEGVQSMVLVKDPGGNDVGPRISLSATVLTTGQQLQYTCIENSDAEDNVLGRIEEDGSWVKLDADDYVPGSLNSRVCNPAVDSIFWCTIVSGLIAWKKDYGGKYCCSAATDEWYYIHWINPVLHVSPDRTLTNNAYGTEQMFHCSVDMTPTTISYNGIFNVEWQWLGAQTQNVWRILERSSTVTSTLSSTGANYTLTIRDFNPIKHGGVYRCIATVKRFDTRLVSERFSITAEPKATLKNNKRSDFTFGMYESDVKFACDALSYPFPSSIEFRVHAKVVNAQTKGVSDYEADILSINVDVHKASFVVNNMSEVFTNDTILECRVTGAGGKTAVSQERIILEDFRTPVERTTVSNLELPENVQGSNDEAFPKATLRNNKRSKFVFGMTETVKFLCKALSFSFPTNIEFRVDGQVLNSETRGVRDYEEDILSVDVDAHKASFVVNSMSEVFHNDSLLECGVTYSDGSVAISQERILLLLPLPIYNNSARQRVISRFFPFLSNS